MTKTKRIILQISSQQHKSLKGMHDKHLFEPVVLCFQYRQFELRPARGQHALKLRLCDTMGLEEKDGLHIGNIPYILEGNIQDKFKVCHFISNVRGLPWTSYLANRQVKPILICLISCVLQAWSCLGNLWLVNLEVELILQQVM